MLGFFFLKRYSLFLKVKVKLINFLVTLWNVAFNSELCCSGLYFWITSKLEIVALTFRFLPIISVVRKI